MAQPGVCLLWWYGGAVIVARDAPMHSDVVKFDRWSGLSSEAFFQGLRRK